ncbi:MAG: M14 family metallopeptidase [Candidatus Aminicenantes bacterium]|nr:M14 family metallopeptidase [Candidatus Aminicenantes bacterium]
MKRSFFILCVFILTGFLTPHPLFPTDPAPLSLTTAEASNFTRTTLYKEVIEFLFIMQKKSNRIKILELATSTEGRMIPMVVISEPGIKSASECRLSQKPVVLINANIHAGEVEGKEAALMLIREFANHKCDNLLKNQVVLIIPIFNPDGNEKLGKNRRDNGPEQAGTRANGQNLDLNRDFLKMESPEVKALIKCFNEWDPVLFVDLHTTNGSYHREPVTYMTLNNPNTAAPLRDYMWNKFFPATSEILKKKYGYDSLPYGNFVDRAQPEKGWRNHAFEARYSTNYAGLRNMFTILDENYSHADFKTRVLACFGFIKSILEYTDRNIIEMREMLQEVNRDTTGNFHREKFTLAYKNEQLSRITIKSYEFKKKKIKPEDRKKYPPWYGDYLVTPTKKHRDYTVPYFTKAVPTREIELPTAYILTPHHDEIVQKLKDHGITVEKIRKAATARVEKFVIEELKLANRMYQGHVFVTLKGSYVEEDITLAKDAYYISMEQPLARLIAILLEPECSDSFAAWGFFNRELARQWSSRFGDYPVYRLHKPIPLELYQD